MRNGIYANRRVQSEVKIGVLLISLAFEHCVLRATFDPHWLQYKTCANACAMAYAIFKCKWNQQYRDFPVGCPKIATRIRACAPFWWGFWLENFAHARILVAIFGQPTGKSLYSGLHHSCIKRVKSALRMRIKRGYVQWFAASKIKVKFNITRMRSAHLK